MKAFFNSDSRALLNCTRVIACLTILYLGAVIFFNIRHLSVTGWPIGELMINYQGGFVRRGLYGQLLLSLGMGSPLWLAALMQKIIISVLILCIGYSVFIWRSLGLTIIFALSLALSPGALLDMAAGGGFEYLDRKELIFYLGLFSIYFIVANQTTLNASRLFLISFICSLMVLTHEIFYLVFCPPLFALLLFNAKTIDHVKFRTVGGLVVIPISLIFLLTLFFAGDGKTAAAITASLNGTDAQGAQGGILAIAWKLQDTINFSKKMYTEGSILFWVFHYLIGLGFNAVFCFLLMGRTKYDKVLCFSFIWIYTAIIICACLGWDWGRWISIANIGTALMFAVVYAYQSNQEPRKPCSPLTAKHQFILLPFISLLCILSLYTRTPHCCAQGLDQLIFSEQSFKRIFLYK